jgi:Cu-Zn family superoxide dismutase
MRFLATAGAAVLLLAGAAFSQQMKNSDKGMMDKMDSGVTKAVCILMPKGNDNVHGVITFEAVEGGIKVVADVSGLTPGKHGFHIHENGDCTSPDFKSAGGHLMAKGEMHAGPTDPNRHIGDMGNLVADAEGNAHLSIVDNKLSFTGPHSILGRAIIVHEGEDDLSTQPTGNAGGRAACGTIGIAQ